MQKKSLLTTFSFYAITALISVIVIFGTLIIVLIISDIEESEALLEQNILSYTSELQQPFDELSYAFENAQLSFYNKVNHILDKTTEYLLNDYDLFDRGKISSIDSLNESFKLYPVSSYEGYFILDEDGDVIYDETGLLDGNITEMIDDAGEKVYSSELLPQNVSDFHFSSSWMKSNGLETYYASFKKLNKHYYIGLLTSKSNTIEIYKSEYISKFRIASELQSSRYHILDFDGQIVLGNVSLTKPEISDLIENRNINQIMHMNHAMYGEFYYQIFPELEWIIINQDHFLTDFNLLINDHIGSRNVQLIFMIHLVVFMICAIILSFAFMSKRTKRKLDHQIDILNASVISNTLIGDNNILYSEFMKVVQAFNKLMRGKEKVLTTKEKTDEEDHNKSYFMKVIKYQFIDSHLLDPIENFNLKPLIHECLDNMKLADSVFKAEIICEQDIKMNQNKALIQGLVRFFVTNLIFNTGFLEENTITIEIYADERNVNLSFVRNVNKKYLTYENIIYDLFEEIDDVIMSTLGGSFDYSNYKHGDRKLTVQCPLVK